MQPANAFFVIASQSSPEPRITLGRAGFSETLTLNAAGLRAQYAFPWGDVLLVLDDDCPFEEELHLVLVREIEILDQVDIGFPYTPAAFEEIGHVGSELRFTFEAETVWTVRVNEKGVRRLWGLPAGAHRRGRWFRPRHISLSHGATK